MTTPLYPTFKRRVNDGFDQLIKRQVTPWAFFNSGHPLLIETFDGRQIHYQGGGFEGSPQHVFWSRYIEPFLENICITEINAAVSMARERGVDGKLLLVELQELLMAGCLRVYKQMADVDRRLRGRGYPKSVELRPINGEVAVMNQFIEEHIRAELEMWKPSKSGEHWFSKANSWQIIGTVIAIATLVVAIIALLV